MNFSRNFELQTCYRRDSVPTTLGYLSEVILRYTCQSRRTWLNVLRSLQRSSASQPVPRSYYDQAIISFQEDFDLQHFKPKRSDPFTQISQGHRDRVPISTSNLSQTQAPFWRQLEICSLSSHLPASCLADNHRIRPNKLPKLARCNHLWCDLFLSPNQSNGVPVQRGVLQKT